MARIRPPDGRKNHHKKPDDAPRMTQKERFAKMRAEGKQIGRPQGSRNVLPMGAIKVLNTLNEKKFRVRQDIDDPETREAAAEQANVAREQTYKVLMGKGVSVKRAPSSLRAAEMLLEEVTEPIVKASRIEGALTLGGAVAAAAAAIAEQEAEQAKPEVEAKGPVIHRKGEKGQ